MQKNKEYRNNINLSWHRNGVNKIKNLKESVLDSSYTIKFDNMIRSVIDKDLGIHKEKNKIILNKDIDEVRMHRNRLPVFSKSLLYDLKSKYFIWIKLTMITKTFYKA